MFAVPLDAVMDRAPYSVRTYMEGEDGLICFHALRFSLMGYQDNDIFISDAQMHTERLIGIQGWDRRLKSRQQGRNRFIRYCHVCWIAICAQLLKLWLGKMVVQFSGQLLHW